MKKLTALLLVLALALALAPMALADPAIVVSSQSLTVDGVPVRCLAYNVDGYNYFQIRDLAMLLRETDSRFSVDYDAEKGQVLIVRGQSYTPLGTEQVTDGADESASSRQSASRLSGLAQPSRQTIVIDGTAAEGLSVWNIAGHNYFKLAELGPRLNFKVSYDEASHTVRIESAKLLPPRPEVKLAASYGEVLSSLKASRNRGGMDLDEEEAETAQAATAEGSKAAETPAATNTASADDADVSGTNVQVEGIDEGDIVKTDGQYIYVLNGEYQLTIIRAAGTGSAVVSRTKVGQSDYHETGSGKQYSYDSKTKNPREMYVSDGRLAILSNYSAYSGAQTDDGWTWEDERYCCVDLYDVSNPAAPKLLSSLGQDGNLLSSRLLDGRLYVVTNQWVYSYDEDEPETYVPCLYRDGKAETLPAGRIYLCGDKSNEYVVVSVYDIPQAALLDSQSLLGAGDQLYMSGDSLYVMGSVWESTETGKYTESVYTVTSHRDSTNTAIYRFDLSEGLRFVAGGMVPGYLDSQFSADEYQGNLRIVTTKSENVYKVYEDARYNFTNYQWEESKPSSGLYILDGDLNLLGSVTDLAEGERVYSARFDGDIAYFTTFRNVDPLFTVDVSDPVHPAVLSALKISGFSEYLHGWAEGKLFGFGREADEEDGRTEGLKLVMFNTEDKTDVYAESVLELDADYSEALYNHKAFFISPAKNLIGFQADETYRIYAYDADAGFTELCRFDFEDGGWRMRGLYIGSWVYIVGAEQLAVLDMNSWGKPVLVNIG
ncbi:MAG: beta-propeller domain-containing protein [Oscillospiraceae bacterium]|nr:beta-propeller domain-containing protein [Oscillospiraceae bacterium]